MSDYRFGCDDYRLNIYPTEAFDGMGGFDIDKVERVEIERVDFVRERECENMSGAPHDSFVCSNCGCLLYYTDRENEPCFEGLEEPRFCLKCGARIKAVKR